MRRRKCTVNQPGRPCSYCSRRNLACSSMPTKSGAGRDSAPAPSTTPWTTTWSPTSTTSWDVVEADRAPSQGTRMPPPALCEELVHLYFRYIHDTFHSLFHQPSLLEDVRNGTVPPAILLSIISLSSRFSHDSFFDGINPRMRGQPYARQAQQMLDLRDLSVDTIRTCVLLGAFVIANGEAGAESLYYSVACRLAMIIDLPNMPADTRLEQETNIRTWWTLNMVDVWSSNGVGLPRSITPRDDVPYPMEEVVFLRMRRDENDLPSPTAMQESTASLLTQMVKLNAVLFEISQLIRATLGSTPKPRARSFTFDATVDALGGKLEDWYSNIPPQLKDTPGNLERYASLGLGHFFVAVYLGYYHFGQLLYYLYLDADIAAGDSQQTDILAAHATHYANKCKFHATALCEILYRAYSTPGCEVYYTMVGHVLVIASTVQLSILLFSPSESATTAARERLEKNFEILTKLQTYWPTLDVCFTRFREFHRACLDEKRRNGCFRMDYWMHQFLFEFANPVNERDTTVGWSSWDRELEPSY